MTMTESGVEGPWTADYARLEVLLREGEKKTCFGNRAVVQHVLGRINIFI